MMVHHINLISGRTAIVLSIPFKESKSLTRCSLKKWQRSKYCLLHSGSELQAHRGFKVMFKFVFSKITHTDT